jgi:hypothetical protein
VGICGAGFKPTQLYPDLHTTMTNITWLSWTATQAVGVGTTKTCAPGNVDCSTIGQQITYYDPVSMCDMTTFTHFRYSVWKGEGSLQSMGNDAQGKPVCQWYFNSG